VIDIDVMEQLKALSNEIESLHEDIARLNEIIQANNSNLIQYVEKDLNAARDAATRATNKVVEFGGRLDDFEDQQNRFKTDFEWWTVHLTKLSDRIEAQLKQMSQLEVSLALDNMTFKEWATAKITQIGRIFRR
jgi:chromosome segregation ATPase